MNIYKKAIANMCLAGSLMLGNASAEDKYMKPECSPNVPQQDKYVPHGFLKSGASDKYIGLRVSRTFHSENQLWSEIYLDLPKGIFADLLYIRGLDDSDFSSNFGDEIQSTIGWKGKISEMDASLSVCFSNIYPTDKLWNGDTILPSFRLSKDYKITDHLIRPELAVEWIAATDDIASGAIVLRPNVTHRWKAPLGIDPLTINQNGMLVWDDGFNKPKNSSDGIFFRYSACLDWQLSRNVIFSFPQYIISEPITDPHDGRKGDSSIGGSLMLKF